MSLLGNIIFDLDGTLLDANEVHAAHFSQILRERFGIDPGLSRREYLLTSGMPLDEQFQRMLRANASPSNCQPEVLKALVVEFNRRAAGDRYPAFREVLTVLHALHLAGYTLFISSGSAPDLVASKLERAAIAHYFALALGTDKTVPRMVKGEQHIERIRAFLSVSSQQMQAETLMVGDAPFDMRMGKSAGFYTIGRASDGLGDALRQAGADRVITDLIELAEILQNGPGSWKPIRELKGDE